MFKMLKKTTILLIFVIISASVCYANIKIFVNTREVEINETFNLTVEISEDINGFQLPKLPDFVVILKNTQKQNKNIIYTYSVAPKSEGIFQIPSITCGNVATLPISIRVYRKSVANNKKYSHKDSNSSVSAELDTNIVYVNQVVLYTIKFKTRRDLSGNPTYTLPMFQNFWKGKSKNKSGYKLIDGENYFTFEVTTPLYPIRDGILTIDPSSVSIHYLNLSSETKFETEKANVKVLPLPEMGKPESFSGAVGKYSISAIANKKELKINEPMVLTITIKGNGNINTVSEPKINLSNDIKKYATTIKTNVDNLIGFKRFQCVLIPLMEGEKIIPSITFSYFDPDTKEYNEISTKQIKINVLNEKSSEDFNSIEDIVSQTNKENFTEDNSDKLIVKSDLDVSKKDKFLIKNNFFIYISLMFVLFIICSYVYRQYLVILSKDEIRTQKLKSMKLFVKYHKQAQIALNKYQKFDFYNNIELALKMLLSSKNNYNYIFMTKNEIRKNLYDLNFDEKFVDNIIDLFIMCEKFKFTSVIPTQNEMKMTFSQLKFIKEQLDKKI